MSHKIKNIESAKSLFGVLTVFRTHSIRLRIVMKTNWKCFLSYNAAGFKDGRTQYRRSIMGYIITPTGRGWNIFSLQPYIPRKDTFEKSFVEIVML